MLAPETRTIGEHTYRVTQLGTFEGQEVLVRIVKLIGPSGSSFLDGLGAAAGSGEKIEASLAMGISEAVREVTTRLSGPDLLFATQKFAARTDIIYHDRAPTLANTYDVHFAGAYDEWIGWLAFCLEVNFRSFFVGGGGIVPKLGRLLSKLGLVSQSPSTSPTTGTSTESQRAGATTPV